MNKSGKVAVADSEIDEALTRGREYDRRSTKIVSAHYDRERDQLVASLSTGATLSVPRRSLPRFDAYSIDDFGPVRIEPPGYALWFDKPDIGVRIEGLLRAAGGEDLIRSVAAHTLGSAKSEKKAEAARKNGVEGGRPPKDREELTATVSVPASGAVRKKLVTGATAPQSGEYKVSSRAGRADQTVVRGHPLPPSSEAHTKFEVQRPARNQSGKKR